MFLLLLENLRRLSWETGWSINWYPSSDVLQGGWCFQYVISHYPFLFFFSVVLSYHPNFSWTSPPITKASRVKHLIWPEQLCSAFSTHDWSNQICNLWHRPQRLAGVWGVAVTTVKCLPDPCDFTPPLLIRTCILRSKTLQDFYRKSARGM